MICYFTIVRWLLVWLEPAAEVACLFLCLLWILTTRHFFAIFASDIKLFNKFRKPFICCFNKIFGKAKLSKTVTTEIIIDFPIYLYALSKVQKSKVD